MATASREVGAGMKHEPLKYFEIKDGEDLSCYVVDESGNRLNLDIETTILVFEKSGQE